MLRKVYCWWGVGKPHQSFEIDEIWDEMRTLLLMSFFEKEYFDALCLMHGSVPKHMMVWDWYEETMDKIQMRDSGRNLNDEMNRIVCSDDRLFSYIGEGYYRFQLIQKNAEKAWERRNDPPITFTGSFL